MSKLVVHSSIMSCMTDARQVTRTGRHACTIQKRLFTGCYRLGQIASNANICVLVLSSSGAIIIFNIVIQYNTRATISDSGLAQNDMTR